jgi:hypothetical protein
VQQHGIQPISQSNFLADLNLTGSGESYANCGHYFTVGCLDVEKHRGMNLDGIDMENKVVLRRRRISCHRPICPECWKDWANREAEKAVQRLNAYVLFDSNHHSLKPIHVIISVPYSDLELSLKQMRRKAYNALKRVHCLGGMAIFHPKRQNKAGNWYFSPHFHILGYGWITDVRANYIYSGYIVKNVGIRKTVHGTIFYQLSHCGISKDEHTVTWFGKLGYAKLRVKYVIEEKEACPLCKGAFHEVIWIGAGDCNLPDLEGITFYDDLANWVVKPKLRWQT